MAITVHNLIGYRGEKLISKRKIFILAALVSAFTMISAVNGKASGNKRSSEDKDDVTVEFSLIDETETAEDGTMIADSDYMKPKITVIGDSELNSRMTDNLKDIHRDFRAAEYRVFNMASEDYDDYKNSASGSDKRKKSSSTADDFSAYNLSQYCVMGRTDDKVISFRTCRSSYTGDSHGDYSYTGYNYDAKTGELLKISDITDDKNTFRSVCVSEIKRQCTVMGISEKYRAAAGEIVNDGSWYFTRAGICFSSSPYLIAPYSYGAPEFTVSYDKLEKCIRSDYMYSGNRYIAAAPGDTISTDLDGDGKADELLFTDKAADESTESADYDSYAEDTPVLKLEINGKDYSDILDQSGVSDMDGDVTKFYAVDLDTDDNLVDIAVVFSGYDDDVYTEFFSYNGKKVYYLGEVGDELLNNTCVAKGDGTVSASGRISLLESTSALFTYELDNGKLKQLTQDMYPIDYSMVTSSYRKHDLQQKLTVYESKDRKSKKRVLTEKDGPVSFPETDNEHWVGVKTKDGKEYYMYMNEFSIVDNGGKDAEATDIFDNLYLAD